MARSTSPDDTRAYFNLLALSPDASKAFGLSLFQFRDPEELAVESPPDDKSDKYLLTLQHSLAAM
eukprot:13036022-Alexandrium_andersonii.AAC.1